MENYLNMICEIQKELKAEYDIQLTIDEIIEPKETKQDRKRRTDLGKLDRNRKTPDDEFIIPILKALHDMGGKGSAKAVIERVEKMMKDRLNHIDRQKNGAPPNPIKWVNTANWARNTMVHKTGLMKSGSKQGIWEISSKGIDFLKTQTHQKKR